MTLKLKQLRESRGITQTFMAKQLGFSSVTIYHRLENDRRKLEVQIAKKIADIFGVKMEDLFFDDDLAK